MSDIPHPEALITNRVGYAIFISLSTVVFGLLAAKSWLHKKSAQHLQEQTSPDTSGDYELLGADTHQSFVERHHPKDQSYFASQIFPKSTLRMQRYATSIDHYLAAIRTPLVLLAITILLYTFPNSELCANARSGTIAYNIVFHLFEIAALVSFYTVANMDPGIIKPHRAPKNHRAVSAVQQRLSSRVSPAISPVVGHNDETTVLLDGGEYTRFDGSRSASRSQSANDSPHSRSPSKRIEIECDWNNDTTIPASYCPHCFFLHPIRAKHCYEIGACVARYDHYCKLIENAVGAKNLRYVVLHLVLDCVVHIWALAMLVYVVVIDIGNGKKDDILGWVLLVGVIGYLVISSLTRTVHLFDHIQTISKNQTIAEKVDPQRIRDVLSDGYHGYDDGDDREVEYHDRYFDEGFFRNWLLCFTGYAANVEYMEGIACKLMFEEEDRSGGADGVGDEALFIH